MRLELLERDLGEELADLPDDVLLAAVEAALPRYLLGRLRSKLPFVVAALVLVVLMLSKSGGHHAAVPAAPAAATPSTVAVSQQAAAAPLKVPSAASLSAFTPGGSDKASSSSRPTSDFTGSGGEAGTTTTNPNRGAATYTRVATITGPNIPPSGVWMPGAGWVDQERQLYLLADSDSDALDIFDARTMTLVGSVHGLAKPNGVTVDDRGLAWVAARDGAVRVVDLTTRSVVATIPTNGTGEAVAVGFDPRDHILMVTNPRENPPSPPFVTFISTTSHAVLGRTELPNAAPQTGQPVWDDASSTFLVPTGKTVGATVGLPAGELVAIDPLSTKVVRQIPLGTCVGTGAVVGPHREVLVGCLASAPAMSGVIVNVDSGQVVTTIAGGSAVDQVTYDPAANLYYLAAVAPPDPAVTVVDADTHAVVASIATGVYAHSVAVSSDLQRIFVPITGQGVAVFERRTD